MSVPLGHKNHTTSHGKRMDFLEKYSKRYKVVDDCLALTMDGKSVVRLDPLFTGELIIPEGVENARHNAFDECWDVKEIAFPKSFKSFDGCFYCGAEVLKFKSLPIIPGDFFQNYCPIEIIVDKDEDVEKLRNLLRTEKISIVKSDRWTWRRTMINDEIIEHGRKDEFGVLYSEDGKTLLKFNKELRSYVIPEGVDAIAISAFQESSIENIVMPKTMRVIGEDAFDSCKLLTSVVFNSGLRRIYRGAFDYCENLQKVSFPNSVISIGSFCGCKSLTKVKLPSSLKEISPRAFYQTNIKEIRIPDTVQIIGADAFSLTPIENIHLPSSLCYIGQCAFSGCKELQWINIPANVEMIALSTFRDCKNLEEVHFEGKIKSIERLAFSGCSKLKSIVIPEQENIWFDTFNGCASLKKVEIPSSVRTICKGAFCNCTSLETLVLNEGLELINEAIDSTALKELVIPSTISFFDTNVLLGVKTLERITFMSVSKKIILGNLPSIMEVHIRKGTRSLYYCSNPELLIEDD